ncbi:MAG: linear amide C-N hydrolase [Fermentimonas sp.]|nr:linear amide C-N hydrolase [Fermentimonas sp.]
MKSKLLFLFFVTFLLISPRIQGCTTFLMKDANGNLYFGRNFDFNTGEGLIHINERNMVKQALVLPPDKPFSWVSLYGSITFNQVGREFPYGGMNEVGLVVEQMWLDDTRYPEPDQRPALNELQWIQFQLDRAATLQQVIDSDTLVRISDKPFSYIHFLVTDAQGDCAVIEFLDGKMVVHRAEELPVAALSNSTYEKSINYREMLGICKVDQYDEMEHNSSGRFSKVAERLEEYDGYADAMKYSFETLDSVSQGEFTRWSIVYDVNHRLISYKTEANPLVQSIVMDNFDFSCGGRHLSRSIEVTATGINDFMMLTPEINLQSLKIMKLKVPFLKDLPVEQMEFLSSWFLRVQCN